MVVKHLFASTGNVFVDKTKHRTCVAIAFQPRNKFLNSFSSKYTRFSNLLRDLFNLVVRKRLSQSSEVVFCFRLSIIIFSIRIKITLFSLFGINHFLRQFLVGLQLFLHFFGNIPVGQQFITIRNNFQEFCSLNSNIIRFFSLDKAFLNLKNISLNFFRFLGDFITRKLNNLRTLCNIRIFRITASFIGKSLIEISLRISDLFLILRTHHFNRSKSRVVGRSIDIATSGGIRNIRSAGRTSNTSAAGGVAKNSIRRNTSKTPTSRSIARIIVAIFAIPSLLLIIELLLHILKVVLLLKGHFLLLVLPITAGLNATKKSICSTRCDITNSTGGSRTHQTTERAKSFTEI